MEFITFCFIVLVGLGHLSIHAYILYVCHFRFKNS